MLDRRQFVARSVLATTVAAPLEWLSAAESHPVALRPTADAGDLFRVRIELEAKGNVNVSDNPLVSREQKRKLPISSTASFDYEERLHWPEGSGRGSDVTLAERYYHVAKSSSLLNRNPQLIDLRPSVRETIVRRELLPEVIYAVEDYFRHDELELLQLPASSVAVDRLLPLQPVRVGSVYELSDDVLVSVLNLSSCQASEVRAEVKSLTAKEARIEFRGKLDGSVDGVPTRVRTIGKLTFDRVIGTSTWLAMGVHETREIGIAEPGFDVSATLRMLRRPLDRPLALPAKPRPLRLTDPIPEDRLFVELQSREIGFSVLMDRRWRLMTDVPGAAMMRMIDNDRSVAQCDFRPLARLSPGAQWTLEALQQDVQRTLGEQLGQLIAADQRLSDSGLRVLRVIAQGAVEGVPIQWIVMHFSDDSGRRVLATFTMEADNGDRFAGSDVQLAGSLRLIEPSAATAEDQPTRISASQPSVSETTTGIEELTVPKADFGESIEVQSASDLRPRDRRSGELR